MDTAGTPARAKVRWFRNPAVVRPLQKPLARSYPMDRPVDSRYRRNRIARRVLLAVAVLSIASVAAAWASAWIKPSVSRARIRTAKVDRGPVEATITASGTVVPEFEQVLS